MKRIRALAVLGLLGWPLACADEVVGTSGLGAELPDSTQLKAVAPLPTGATDK